MTTTSRSRPRNPRPPPDTEAQELADARLVEPKRIASSRHGMVVSAHYDATAAGARVLREGGNAVDAAIATAFALGVCEPAASGLGGQTMMLIHLAKTRKTIALDGSSRAPHRAIPGALGPVERRRGYRSTTVPSTPAALDYARRHYGRFRLSQVLEPAIELAENGVVVSKLQHSLTRRERKALRDGNAGVFFLKGGRKVYPAGSVLKQPVLAQTLRRLAKAGVKDFYTGRIARTIHADMVANDGLIRKDDLAQIPQPIERRPVSCWFQGDRVLTMPPPGAGRTLVEMLQILDTIPIKRRDPDTPRGAVLLAEVIRQAYRDRQDRPFDPNYYAQVKAKRMVSQDYAKEVGRKIRRQIKTRGETTHLSVMDAEGNVVALTQSIERVYGACVATEELGFLYNDYMMAFEHEDYSHPYYLRPNAVPWASVAPTIVFRQRKPWLAIGSPGSERIAPAIVQVLTRLRHEKPLEAVSAPRLYCNAEGKVSIEAARVRDDVLEALERHGFDVDRRDAWSFYLGCIALAMHEGDRFVGVADPRRDGAAAGPGAPKA